MKKMEFEKIKNLNITYDKLFIRATYNMLKEKDLAANYHCDDPFYKKKVKINRSEDFLNLWQLFFKKLSPLLVNLSYKERFDLIHYIFGNSIKNTLTLWYHWPLLEEVAVFSTKDMLNKHIEFINARNKYELY